MTKPEFSNPSEIDRVWALVALIFGLPVFFLLAHFGYRTSGLIAASSIFSIFINARYFWYERRESNYWLLIAALIPIHAGVSYLFKHNINGPGLLISGPFTTLDVVAIYALFKFVLKKNL